MIRLDSTTDKRLLASQALWFGAWLFVSGVGLALKPNSHRHGTHTQLGLPACPSVQLFDRPCPGCGLTTSFALSVRGQFVEAFHANAFGPFLYILFTVSALAAIIASLSSRRIRISDVGNWILIGAFGLFLAYGVIRFAVVKLDSPFFLGSARLKN